MICPASLGWGREGHQIIVTVAEDHLDETTKVMIQSLLGNKGSPQEREIYVR
jgi:hypothetical protein